MKFSVYQVSRRGGREKNEDRMGYCYTREAGLFALADGMGGHPEGEVASQLTLQAMATQFQSQAKPALDDPRSYLEEAVMAGHQQLLRYAANKGLSDTPRTTVVACALQGNQSWWAHCGDSRLYLVRQRRLIARTRDHSYSELQEALGRVTAGAERFNRNVLFTCLGSPGRPMVDIHGPFTLELGDRFLLCSDGLWNTLPDEEITAQLAARPIADAVLELVERALRQGGPRCDNVTALAVEWEGADAADTTTDEAASDAQGDSEFASTIQPAPAVSETATDVDRLDDGEMDRSVREIQAAIQQRSVKK